MLINILCNVCKSHVYVCMLWSPVSLFPGMSQLQSILQCGYNLCLTYCYILQDCLWAVWGLATIVSMTKIVDRSFLLAFGKRNYSSAQSSRPKRPPRFCRSSIHCGISAVVVCRTRSTE